MKKYKIPRREGNQVKPFSHDELHEMYLKKRMSTQQIAKLKGCAPTTVISGLRRTGIQLRTRNDSLFGRRIVLTDKFLQSVRTNQAKRWASLKANPPFGEDELRNLYLGKGLGTHEIAKMKNTTHQRVLSWMNRYGIERRSTSEACKIYIMSHPSHLQKLVLGLRHGSCHPNKAEAKLNQLLVKQHFPFRYTGNGSVSVGGLSPDFIATDDSKRIIELFGNHWHDAQDEEIRKTNLAQFGYKTLIIWEHELKDEEALLSKLRCWNEG